MTKMGSANANLESEVKTVTLAKSDTGDSHQVDAQVITIIKTGFVIFN